MNSSERLKEQKRFTGEGCGGEGRVEDSFRFGSIGRERIGPDVT
jgi:hypothetical protein